MSLVTQRISTPHGAVTLCCRRIALRAGVTDVTNRRDGRPSRSGGGGIYARRYLGLVVAGGTELHKERGPGGTRRVERDPEGPVPYNGSRGDPSLYNGSRGDPSHIWGLWRTRAECAAGR